MWVHNVKLIIDTFHFPNHVGKLCKQMCDPFKYLPQDLHRPNTEACEQAFVWCAPC